MGVGLITLTMGTDLGGGEMKEVLLARLARWICKNFGHQSRIHYDFPGGGDPEICSRCNSLLSTAYSRQKEAGT